MWALRFGLRLGASSQLLHIEDRGFARQVCQLPPASLLLSRAAARLSLGSVSLAACSLLRHVTPTSVLFQALREPCCGEREGMVDFRRDAGRA